MMLIKPQVMEVRETTVLLNIICPMCLSSNELEVSKQGFKDYDNGALIQNAFPTLTPDQREFLLSGICNTCWEKTFKEEE